MERLMQIYKKYLRKTIYVLGILCFPMIIGCSTLKQIPVQTIEKEVIRDSLIYIKDTIEVEIPKEIVREVLPELDTSILKTSFAESIAYLDTAKRMINHTLEQKGAITFSYDTVYITKIVEKTVDKETPIEVIKEVKRIPNFFWYSLIFNILVVLFIAFKIYLKFKIK